ncbi:16S rRNA (guanine(527)-N(7))-methyltransferase RsmG [Desulfovirgula thermocuniculi]|uniref:16S rRNA (guanine(527)-N(7))-methyltransferase RsmG n=1 Tax=Desulfovirgula thermocuniculi TaxID=348842 RepID=UPI000418C980|nr:16S rRNA (guanine(527)-N(7))-methyltransferase RsmG [Desulfovirgula thermocuniculi]
MKGAAELDELLCGAARRWGVEVGKGALERFRAYLNLLLEWNRRINLTAVVEPREVYVKHFIDSLSLLALYRPHEGISAVDIGSGAGFPGMPLKIVREDLELTLVEAVGKKAFFLEQLVRALGLRGVKVVKGRAEELGRRRDFRGGFGLAMARAVAPLPVLLEYALPLLREGALFVAYKGPGAKEEVDAARGALALLGGEIKRVERLELPYAGHERVLVFVEKVGETPPAYPRRTAAIRRRPL